MGRLRNWFRRRAIGGKLGRLAAESASYYQRGLYDRAIATNSIASDLIAERLGRNTYEYAFSLQSLADIHSQAGDPASAARSVRMLEARPACYGAGAR